MPSDIFNNPPTVSAAFGNFSGSAFQAGLGCALIAADSVLDMIAQEILKTGGGIAFALQSLLHIIASESYYEESLFFTDASPTNLTNFIEVQIPGARKGIGAVAGFMPGYVTVMALILMHCLLFSIISWWFIQGEGCVIIGI
jgi:hypothetical protein